MCLSFPIILIMGTNYSPQSLTPDALGYRCCNVFLNKTLEANVSPLCLCGECRRDQSLKMKY